MVNKWRIINTLQNSRIVTRTLVDLSIDTETINAGNFSVTARCHIGDNMDDLLIKCYLYSDPTREKIYGSMYYKEELAIFSPSGVVEYVDVVLARWIEGVALNEYLYNPNSNFAELSRSFDIMAYSLLLEDVVHCDIKPDNIIVDMYGQMTLIDHDALWCESWGIGARRELGTVGYRALNSDEHTPPIYSRNYPIVLISIMLASLSWEYNTIYPYIENDALFNPNNKNHFIKTINCAKDIFKRAGDESHLVLCDIISPTGVNAHRLEEKMYNAAFMRSAFDWQTGSCSLYE